MFNEDHSFFPIKWKMYTPTAYDTHSFLARNVLLKSKRDIMYDKCQPKGNTYAQHCTPESSECPLPLLSSTDSRKTWYNSNFINLLNFWCLFDVKCILLALQSGIFSCHWNKGNSIHARTDDLVKMYESAYAWHAVQTCKVSMQREADLVTFPILTSGKLELGARGVFLGY